MTAHSTDVVPIYNPTLKCFFHELIILFLLIHYHFYFKKNGFFLVKNSFYWKDMIKYNFFGSMLLNSYKKQK